MVTRLICLRTVNRFRLVKKVSGLKKPIMAIMAMSKMKSLVSLLVRKAFR